MYPKCEYQTLQSKSSFSCKPHDQRLNNVLFDAFPDKKTIYI